LNEEVYQTALYSSHGQNTSVADNSAAMIFADSPSDELLTLTGNTTDGYAASFQIGVPL